MMNEEWVSRYLHSYLTQVSFLEFNILDSLDISSHILYLFINFIFGVGRILSQLIILNQPIGHFFKKQIKKNYEIVKVC